jgi:hypothetical protein
METGTTPPVTVTGEPTVVAVPAQVAPEKNSYVTVPPAWNPPVRVTESVTEPPALMVVAERVVVIVGLNFETVIEKGVTDADVE